MKKLLLYTVLALTAIACSDDDNPRNRNPNLLDTNFSVQLSSIELLDLEIPGNSIYIPNAGLRGVYVINAGSNLLAWEATDPNHVPQSCSRMERSGIEVICTCDDANRYNLFNGQAVGEVLDFAMLNYRVTDNGNNVTISN